MTASAPALQDHAAVLGESRSTAPAKERRVIAIVSSLMSDARTPDPGLRQRIVVSKHVLENWIVPTLIAGVFLTLRGHSFGVKNANVREVFRRNLASRSGTGRQYERADAD